MNEWELIRWLLGERLLASALGGFSLAVAGSELYLRRAERRMLEQIRQRWRLKAHIGDNRDREIAAWIKQRGYHQVYPRVRLGSVIKVRSEELALKFQLLQGKIDYLAVDETYQPQLAILAKPVDWKLELLLKAGLKVLLVGRDEPYEAMAERNVRLAPLLTAREVALVRELEADGFEVFPRLRLIDIVEADKPVGELWRRVDLLVAEQGRPLLAIWSSPLGRWPAEDLKALGLPVRRLWGVGGLW